MQPCRQRARSHAAAHVPPVRRRVLASPRRRGGGPAPPRGKRQRGRGGGAGGRARWAGEGGGRRKSVQKHTPPVQSLLAGRVLRAIRAEVDAVGGGGAFS